MRRRLFPVASPVAGGLSAVALAPLVDLLTLLLVFLLRAFSTDPPLDMHEAFELARSASENEAPRQLAIDATPTSLYVSGRRVGATAYFETGDDPLIREVYDVLLADGSAGVDLRIDAEVPYVVVRKLLHTVREAGVQRVSLVAASKAGL